MRTGLRCGLGYVGGIGGVCGVLLTLPIVALVSGLMGCASSTAAKPKGEVSVVGPTEMPPELAAKALAAKKAASAVPVGTVTVEETIKKVPASAPTESEKALLAKTEEEVRKRKQEMAALTVPPARKAPAKRAAVPKPAPKQKALPPPVSDELYTAEKAELWKVVAKTQDLIFLDTDGSFVLLYKLKHIGAHEIRYEYESSSTNVRTRSLDKEHKKVSLYNERIKPIEQIIQKQYLDAKKESITYIVERNMFFIRVFEETKLNTILEILSKLDAPPAQVHIRVVVAELQNTLDFQWGIEASWRRLRTAGNENTVYDQFTTVLHPSNFIDTLLSPNPPRGAAFDPGYQGGVIQVSNANPNAKSPFDYYIRALENSGYADVESEPEVLVRQGEAARFRSGDEVPIIQISQSGSTIITSTNYKTVGVQLFVTPLVINEQSVVLSVYAELSNVAHYITGPLGTQLPQIRNRNTEGTFEIGFNERLVIGGLKVESKIKAFTGIPILGHVPILGAFLSGKEARDEYSTLYFFVEVEKPYALPKEVSMRIPTEDENAEGEDLLLDTLFE